MTVSQHRKFGPAAMPLALVGLLAGTASGAWLDGGKDGRDGWPADVFAPAALKASAPTALAGLSARDPADDRGGSSVDRGPGDLSPTGSRAT